MAAPLRDASHYDSVSEESESEDDSGQEPEVAKDLKAKNKQPEPSYAAPGSWPVHILDTKPAQKGNGHNAKAISLISQSLSESRNIVHCTARDASELSAERLDDTSRSHPRQTRSRPEDNLKRSTAIMYERPGQESGQRQFRYPRSPARPGYPRAPLYAPRDNDPNCGPRRAPLHFPNDDDPLRRLTPNALEQKQAIVPPHQQTRSAVTTYRNSMSDMIFRSPAEPSKPRLNVRERSIGDAAGEYYPHKEKALGHTLPELPIAEGKSFAKMPARPVMTPRRPQTLAECCQDPEQMQAMHEAQRETRARIEQQHLASNLQH